MVVSEMETKVATPVETKLAWTRTGTVTVDEKEMAAVTELDAYDLFLFFVIVLDVVKLEASEQEPENI